MAHLIATGIGVDPGTTQHAVAYLEAYSDGMVWPRELVYTVYERSRVSNLLARARPHDGAPQGVVTIETIVGGLYGNAAQRRSRFGGVAETKGSERLFRELCKETSTPFVDRAASHGRKVLIGSGTASDKQIQLAVEGIYTTTVPGDDLPWHGPAVHRPHVYDAMVVGMVELLERMAGVDDEGKPTAAGALVEPRIADRIRSMLHCLGAFLPRNVAAQVAVLRGQEKAARDEMKLREKMGLPKAEKAPRRIPTRATSAAGKAKSAVTRLKNKLARM